MINIGQGVKSFGLSALALGLAGLTLTAEQQLSQFTLPLAWCTGAVVLLIIVRNLFCSGEE